MKLGYFTMPLHPPGRPWVETLREDRGAILLADRLGYAQAFVGEHATDAAENITSCAVFLASLAHDTKTIKLGTGTLNLSNSHPVTVATTVAMLDNLLEGRFIMGISPGGLPTDMEVFENLGKDRGKRFLECINHVLAIWAGEPPYDIKGEIWNISTAKTQILDIGQGIMLKPFQKPHPPIVVTAVEPFSKGVTAAAARGWDPISANFLLPKWVQSHWGRYAEGCQQGARKADPANWRVAKTVFVADDARKAKEYGFGAQSPYRFYYSQLLTKLKRAGRANLFKASKDAPDESVTLDGVMRDLVIAGTVDEVVDGLLAFHERVGDFGTLLYCGIDWADAALARRSLELMAEEVMPAL
ncbi:MAG: LLM class flavin-dependent oxidoreductase, partial [Betaproteobacteria bacterium]|nr:LLM class flavin-dependent oxidoreductase [Betaproteobacteria bacterium]